MLNVVTFSVVMLNVVAPQMTAPVRRHDIKYKNTARTTLSIFYCCAESIYTEFHFTEHLYAEFYALSIVTRSVIMLVDAMVLSRVTLPRVHYARVTLPTFV
jgi:hypothetical protein